jgi:hypothetical protein
MFMCERVGERKDRKRWFDPDGKRSKEREGGERKKELRIRNVSAK